MFKKILKWLVIGLSFVFAVIAAFYLVTRSQGIGAWKRYEWDARARGAKLEIKDVLPPRVPDDENVFMAPIFRLPFAEAVAQFDLSEVKSRSSEVWKDHLSSVEYCRTANLKRWRDVFESAGWTTSESAGSDADVILAGLKRFEPGLAQLRQALRRPSSQIPEDVSDPNLKLPPYLAVITSAEELISLGAEAKLASGQERAALDDVRMLLSMSKAADCEGLMIFPVVARRVFERAVNAAWSGLADHRWSAESLDELARMFSEERMIEVGVGALACERAFQNGTYDRLASRGGRNAEDLQLIWSVALPDKRYAPLFPTGWVYENRLRYNEYIDHLIGQIDAGKRQFVAKPSAFVVRSPMFLPAWERRYALADTSLPVIESVLERAIRAEALSRSVVLACALERYRLEHGMYPEAIEDLVPMHLSVLPLDPCANQPLKYRKDPARGYVLYSIGTDGTDNGGQPPDPERRQRNPDWVWTFPATTAP